jgi:hypothetical protein
MQLIKNVFLTREKTVSRKLEEILLVYILKTIALLVKSACSRSTLTLSNGDLIFTV